jgi:starch synthase
MPMALRALVCSSEVVPFAKTGGLADVAGALPKALAALGHDVRVALPKYGSIDSGKIKSRKIDSFKVRMGTRAHSVSVETSDALHGVVTYLVNSPRHFRRDSLYGEPDDPERFALFCRAVIEFLRRHDWKPQLIHGNDWQTALLPVYLKTHCADDPDLSPIATLHTVHNLGYQGLCDPGVLDRIGLDRSLFSVEGLEFYGQVNFLKGALVFADLLNTVSETYSREIQTPEYGERLQGVLARREQDLYGVLNGLDHEEWNPATDSSIAATYDAQNLEGKSADKAALQERFDLPRQPHVPIFGLVSRLASQKGLDLLAEVLPHLLRLDVQFCLLGTGEQTYHDLLSRLAARHPKRMGLVLGFDNPLAHQIYAGSDCFLMPSRYEPCGLGQMISLRYGTVPIVRHTGGLADTITEFNPETGEGNGFSFKEHNPVALLAALARALLTMKVNQAWSRLLSNAMACDFSWDRSARRYAELYQLAIERHRR